MLTNVKLENYKGEKGKVAYRIGYPLNEDMEIFFVAKDKTYIFAYKGGNTDFRLDGYPYAIAQEFKAEDVERLIQIFLRLKRRIDLEVILGKEVEVNKAKCKIVNFEIQQGLMIVFDEKSEKLLVVEKDCKKTYHEFSLADFEKILASHLSIKKDMEG